MENREKMLTVSMLCESVGGYIRAGLTGLGGAYTGGPLSGAYDKMKQQAALQAAALKSGRPEDMYNANQYGTLVGHSMFGSIPIVGSVSNMIAYKRRMDAEKQAKLAGEYGIARKRTPEDDM